MLVGWAWAAGCFGTPTPAPPPDAPAEPTPDAAPPPRRPTAGPVDCATHGDEPTCAIDVPGGEGVLGAQATDAAAPGFDAHAGAGDAPVHAVQIAPFRMSRDEIPAAAYAACLASGACDAADVSRDPGLGTVGVEGREVWPATGVSHRGAVRYCTWVGGRLPTADAWEWAARAGDGRPWPWGTRPECGQRDLARDASDTNALDQLPRRCPGTMALLSGKGGDAALTDAVMAAWTPTEVLARCEAWERAPTPTARRALLQADIDAAAGQIAHCGHDGPAPPEMLQGGHPWGLRGLGGNVAEWVGEVGEDGRAEVRGGSWMDTEPAALRAASRLSLPADARLPDVGFRCVWDPATD